LYENINKLLTFLQIDTRSMIQGSSATNADSAAAFITALAVARSLGSLSTTQKESLKKNIAFVLLDGEAFDGIGSKQMVVDMISEKFPFKGEKSTHITLNQISEVIELRQLGLINGKLFAHFDPISYHRNKTGIENIISKLQNYSTSTLKVSKTSKDAGIPTSSIQNILKSRDIPSVLLTEFDSSFTNKHYLSRYDTLRYLGVKLSGNETEKQMFELIKPLAKKLAEVALTTAKALVVLANEDKEPSFITELKTHEDEINHLIFCFLHQSNCSYIEKYMSSKFEVRLNNQPISRYVSVVQSQVSYKIAPLIIYNFLIAYTGSKVNRSESHCNTGLANDVGCYFQSFFLTEISSSHS